MSRGREERLEFDDYDDTPGKPWDDFKGRLMNYAAGRTDDRGWSLADHLMQVDEGSPGVPMPIGNATELRKANAARRRRQRESYAVLTKHIGRCHEHLKYIRTNHFQDGQTAFNYMDAACAAPLNAVKTRELRRQWDDMDLMELVGVQEHTIQVLATKIQAQNAEFPLGSTKDRSECAERLLEMLMDTSKHFQESATDEYNALVGNRRFEHVGHAIHGNHRDLDALVLHYDQQWSAAFNAKLAGFEAKQPTKRPRAAGQMGRESPAERGHIAGERDYEPPGGSPAHSIREIANAGLEIAQHRGTVTTTDWNTLDRDSLCQLAEDGEIEGEAEIGLIFDADDVASVEMICDCCRGLGHPKSKCASNRNRYRSIGYVIGVLQAKHDTIKNNPSRRQPPRGQRQPFRSQPRRFQPRSEFPRGPGQFPRPGSSTSSSSSRGKGGGMPRWNRSETGRSLEEGEQEYFEDSPASSDRESLSTARESANRVFEGSDAHFDRIEQGLAAQGESLFTGVPGQWAIDSGATVTGPLQGMTHAPRQLPPIPEANPSEGHLTAQGRGGFPEGEPKAARQPLGASSTKEAEMTLSAATGSSAASAGIALDDDSLFEHGNIATESETRETAEIEPLPTRLLINSATVLYAIACTIIAFAITAWEHVGRPTGTALILIAVTIGLVPLSRAEAREVALIGGSRDYAMIALSSDLPPACVDSGATTTSIPEQYEHLLTEVTNSSPTQKLYIADDKGLTIKTIGKMSLPVSGWYKDLESGKKVHTNDVLKSTRTFVVKGLGKRTILMSVRGMKRDGINSYFNDDNSTGTSDCLKLPSGTVVPFLSSDHSYHLPASLAEVLALARSAVAGNAPPGTQRSLTHVHNAIGHCGHKRADASNLTMDGSPVKLSDLAGVTCKGCRLGNGVKSGRGAPHRQHGDRTSTQTSSTGFTHFGQQFDSDICTNFVPSFPHGFTSMVNFVDRWGRESYLYFTVGNPPDSHQVASTMRDLHSRIQHRLHDGMIGRWVTDNGLSFHGEAVEDAAKTLCERRGFSVPNVSDSHPVAERHWGVLERMARSDMAHAECSECLWTWSMCQNNLLLYYLATAAHTPPKSPYAFTTGNSSPVDISWARTMFCDVTVTLPERDRNGKLGRRSVDGCHLGYDCRRGAHFVFCESIHRLSTFHVQEWREDSFEHCKRITADSKVEYYEALDLPIAPVTASMLPQRYRSAAANIAGAARLTVLILFERDRPDSIAASLRANGHTVITKDIRDGTNLAEPLAQVAIITEIKSKAYNFVFMSPECQTASIAFKPPLREFPNHVRGLPGLNSRHKRLVDEANKCFDFCAKVIIACREANVRCALESCASRRHPPCEWEAYSSNAFVWDIDTIAAIPDMTYIAFAQCPFNDAEYQKYTGLLVDQDSRPAFTRHFAHAQCTHSTHKRKLQGYDEDGIANTAKSADYSPRLASTFGSAIEESCLSDKEGGMNIWSQGMRSLSRNEFAQSAAESHITESAIADLPIGYDPNLVDLELELWAESAEGAYRVTEISGVKVPETIPEAQASPLWPLIKAAMQEEIDGKMQNKAWKVVKRPDGKHVMKTKWVFAIKFNDDHSIARVKARFVACGYSQQPGVDFSAVFASTLAWVALRLLLCFITDEDLETDVIDAIKAFTQSDIDHELYCEMPEGFESKGFVLLLFKALEGIRQGAHLWFQHNKAALTKLGFKSWTNEPNLYVHETLAIRVGVFVDDTLVGFHRNVKEQYLLIKEQYAKMVNIGESGITPVYRYVGMQITRNREQRTINIRQTKYIEELAAEYKDEIEARETPHGVSKEQRQAFDHLKPAEGKDLIDKGKYLKICGKIVWPATLTRPDISMQASHLSSFTQSAGEPHYSWGLWIIGYLYKTKDLGITYGGRIRIPPGLSTKPANFDENGGLYIIHDSSWGTRARPLGGFIIMYLNGAIDWSAKAVKLVPDSTLEAEQAQASRACKAGISVRMLLRSARRKLIGPTPMLGDNKAYFDGVQQDGATQRTRYYERALLLVKRAVLLLIMVPFLIGTDSMTADILTKPLEKSAFMRHRTIMMNLNGGLRAGLESGLIGASGSVRRVVERLCDRAGW